MLGRMSKRNCAALGRDLPAKERCAKRAGRGRHRSGPKCRLALRREVENDAGAIGNREPRQEPPGGQFLRGPFADARGGTKLRAPPIAPVRALPAAEPWQGPRRRPGAPGSPPCVLLPRRQSLPFRPRECNRQLWRRPKVKPWLSSLWIGRPSNRSINRPGRLWLRLSPRYRAIRPCD